MNMTLISKMTLLYTYFEKKNEKKRGLFRPNSFNDNQIKINKGIFFFFFFFGGGGGGVSW